MEMEQMAIHTGDYSEGVTNNVAGTTDAVLIEKIDQQYANYQVRRKLGILTAHALAAALDVTPNTLATWRAAHKGPPYTKPSKHVFYRIKDVRDWLELCVVQTLNVPRE